MNYQVIGLNLTRKEASALLLRHLPRMKTYSSSHMIKLCKTLRVKRLIWMKFRKTKMNFTKSLRIKRLIFVTETVKLTTGMLKLKGFKKISRKLWLKRQIRIVLLKVTIILI